MPLLHYLSETAHRYLCLVYNRVSCRNGCSKLGYSIHKRLKGFGEKRHKVRMGRDKTEAEMSCDARHKKLRSICKRVTSYVRSLEIYFLHFSSWPISPGFSALQIVGLKNCSCSNTHMPRSYLECGQDARYSQPQPIGLKWFRTLQVY